MNEIGNLQSGFGVDKDFDEQKDTGMPINFSQAKKLERGGGSCDAYVTKRQHRRVFIKKLKAELSGSAVHIAALDKEFEIGVGLSHPSLPEYREHYRDCIVMDYVDGETLSSVIARNDLWLKSEKNVRKMLGELLDVLEYLHHSRVVHCDIKSDNLMLTNGHRKLMLIDLGNCYSDWFDDTAGDPEIYGVDRSRSGSTDIDFHGVGMLLDRLETGRKFSRFRRLCDKSGVTVDELREALKPRRNLANWLILTVGIASVVASLIMFIIHQAEIDKDDTVAPMIVNDSILTESENALESEASGETREPGIDTNAKKIVKPMLSKHEINDMVAASLKELYAPLSRLEQTVNDTTLSGKELLSILADYSELEESELADSYSKVSDMVPESRRDSVYAIYYSCDAYSAYIKESNRIQKRVGEEARSRIKAEKEAGN